MFIHIHNKHCDKLQSRFRVDICPLSLLFKRKQKFIFFL